MEKKTNYAPPGWLVTWFDQVKLDEERAHKFQEFRQRLCDATETNDHINFPFLNHNALWMRALDLLLEQEPELLAEVQKAKQQEKK